MIAIPGTYVLILMILVLILFGFHLVRECQKLLRQHRENPWARDTINQYNLDKTVNPSTREKWKFLIYMIAFSLYMFVLFYHNTYFENRVIKLAQDPKNLMHNCMFFDGYDRYKPSVPYFSIEGKIHTDRYIDDIEKFPSYNKFRTLRFKKNHCYKIKYIKINIPVLTTERIYVYDIDL